MFHKSWNITYYTSAPSKQAFLSYTSFYTLMDDQVKDPYEQMSLDWRTTCKRIISNQSVYNFSDLFSSWSSGSSQPCLSSFSLWRYQKMYMTQSKRSNQTELIHTNVHLLHRVDYTSEYLCVCFVLPSARCDPFFPVLRFCHHRPKNNINKKTDKRKICILNGHFN